MNHLIKSFIKIIILIYCIILFIHGLFNPSILKEIVISTLNIWLYKVFPSIFIIYIISLLLLSTKLIKLITFILSPLKLILKFDSFSSFELFILSIIVGSPSSNLFIIDNINNISKKDAHLLFTNASFITCLFVFSIFDNIYLSISLYISHILSSIIIISFKTYNNKTIKSYDKIKLNVNFFDSIKNISSILLNIATFMIIFNTLIYVFDFLPIFFLSLLEISNGIILLKSINTIYSIIFISFLVSFNGLCIILQSYQYNKTYLKLSSLIINKIIHGLLGLIIFSLLYIIH